MPLVRLGGIIQLLKVAKMVWVHFAKQPILLLKDFLWNVLMQSQIQCLMSWVVWFYSWYCNILYLLPIFVICYRISNLKVMIFSNIGSKLLNSSQKSDKKVSKNWLLAMWYGATK